MTTAHIAKFAGGKIHITTGGGSHSETRVTYTESSGLAPWSGDMPSTTTTLYGTMLYVDRIPNAQYIETVKVGTGVEGQIAADSVGGTCPNLVSVELPYTVTRVNQNAFNGCSKLKTLTIANTTSMEDNTVFLGCSAIETVYITDDGGDSSELKQALIAAGIPSTASWIPDPDEP